MAIATGPHYAAEQDGRGLSGRLWDPLGRQALAEIRCGDPTRGFGDSDDFVSLVTGKYTATQATAGTFALIDALYGVAAADAGSTTDGQGINVQLNTTVGELYVPTANDEIYFECRMRHVDSVSASPADLFIGLSVIDTTMIASSANTSANHIGFESVSEDGVLAFVNEASGTRTSNAAVKTLVANTWTKLGFRVVGTTKILAYVDGVLVATVTTNIPTTEMVPTIVCQASGTAAANPTIDVDWLAHLQIDV